jgi:hypothetical protein
MRSFHFEDVPPEVVLATQVPSSRKVVDLLILVDMLELTWLDQTGPEYIPGRT